MKYVCLLAFSAFTFFTNSALAIDIFTVCSCECKNGEDHIYASDAFKATEMKRWNIRDLPSKEACSGIEGTDCSAIGETTGVASGSLKSCEFSVTTQELFETVQGLFQPEPPQ